MKKQKDQPMDLTKDIKDKRMLMAVLEAGAKLGSLDSLCWAYLIGDICPDDRTTKHVFRKRKKEEAE